MFGFESMFDVVYWNWLKIASHYSFFEKIGLKTSANSARQESYPKTTIVGNTSTTNVSFELDLESMLMLCKGWRKQKNHGCM